MYLSVQRKILTAEVAYRSNNESANQVREPPRQNEAKAKKKRHPDELSLINKDRLRVARQALPGRVASEPNVMRSTEIEHASVQVCIDLGSEGTSNMHVCPRFRTKPTSPLRVA